MERSAKPGPGGNYTNYLNGVKGFASNDVWTVGFYREYSPEELIMHWDGLQWTQEYTPTTNLGQLVGVSGRAANDVWAVGWTRLARTRSWPDRALGWR